MTNNYFRRKRYKRLATLCSDMDKIPSHYGFSLIVKQRNNYFRATGIKFVHTEVNLHRDI